MKMAAIALAASLAGVTAARDFRGVWVATVGNMDFPRCTSAQMFKQTFSNLAGKLARRNCNAVIFQVRANCDAFYPSRLAPYSRWMTGVEGRGYSGFDPLSFMINETRRRGMEFHAWFNPYRVVRATKLSKEAYLARLAPNNFARRNPHLVLAVPMGNGEISLLLNPGEPEVIRYITAVVHEVALRYRPDAIHFDDYFYPYDGKMIPDGETYRRRNPYKLSLANWRRHNVNTLILQVRRMIDRVNYGKSDKVRFGISPFGIWANYAPETPAGSRTKGQESFHTLFADSRLWVKRRYVDYIVPQIYWHRTHTKASFTVLLDWWCNVVRGTGVKLYIGHALYRFGTPGWGQDELIQQLRLVRTRREAAGSVLFSCRHLLNPATTPVKLGVSRVWKNR